MIWYRIQAPHFTAAAEVNDYGRITRAAPIIAWSVGWTAKAMAKYVKRKGWSLERHERPLDDPDLNQV